MTTGTTTQGGVLQQALLSKLGTSPAVVTAKGGVVAKSQHLTHRVENLQIRWTKDYGLFDFIDGNREILGGVNNKHVEQIAEEITEHGFRKECPIFVVLNPKTGKLDILNGQHRYLASQMVDRELAYLIIDKPYEEALYDVLKDHALTKGWQVLDYLKFYAKEKKNPNYLLLFSFAEQYGISALVALKLLTTDETEGSKSKVSAAAVKLAKVGNLQVTAEALERARVYVQRVNSLRNFSPNYVKFKDKSPLLQALCEMVSKPGYDHNRMMTALGEQSSKLVKCTAVKEYTALLVDIYNFRRKSGRLEA